MAQTNAVFTMHLSLPTSTDHYNPQTIWSDHCTTNGEQWGVSIGFTVYRPSVQLIDFWHDRYFPAWVDASVIPQIDHLPILFIDHMAQTTAVFNWWSVDGETDCRGSLLTNSM